MARQGEISFAGSPVRMEGFKQLVFHSWKLHNYGSNDEDAEVDEGVVGHPKVLFNSSTRVVLSCTFFI